MSVCRHSTFRSRSIHGALEPAVASKADMTLLGGAQVWLSQQERHC